MLPTTVPVFLPGVAGFTLKFVAPSFGGLLDKPRELLANVVVFAPDELITIFCGGFLVALGAAPDSEGQSASVVKVQPANRNADPINVTTVTAFFIGRHHPMIC